MTVTEPERRAFQVAAINPFWRYAVALEHRPDIPAIPYFRRASAEAFADESRAAFPDATTLVLERTGWRTLDVAA